MADVSDFDIDRFLKLVGMLGSAHEGERANAAALATRMLRDAGMNWHEFLDKIAVPVPAEFAVSLSRPRFRHTAYNHAEAADLCLLHGRGLSSWEKGFLGSTQDFHRLSAKQQDVLARLCEKCGVDWP